MNKNLSPVPNSVLVRGSNGFVPLIILLVITLLTSIGIGYYAYKNGQIKLPSQEPTQKSENSIGIGFGLSERTLPFLRYLTNANDFVDLMNITKSSDLITNANEKSIQTVCIARSLDGLKEIAALAKEKEVICNYLGYNPEDREGTPEEELNDFVGSSQKAQQTVQSYGLKLVNGPGLKYISKQEENYAQAAKFTDIWLIQTQGLTIDKKTNKHATPEEYNQSVKRVADMLRSGNPEVKIWAQIVLTPGGVEAAQFTPEEIVAYIKSVEGAVDAVRIYTTGTPNFEDILQKIINLLRPS